MVYDSGHKSQSIYSKNKIDLHFEGINLFATATSPKQRTFQEKLATSTNLDFKRLEGGKVRPLSSWATATKGVTVIHNL